MLNYFPSAVNIAHTSFSNEADPKLISPPDDDSGTEVNGYEERDSIEDDEQPPIIPAPYVPTSEPESEKEEEISPFASEM